MEFRGSGCQKAISTIVGMRAFKMLKKGWQGYMCAMQVAEQKERNLHEILIAREFPGVFQEVPRLPPDREIELTIDLVPGTTPIPKTPYQVAPTETCWTEDRATRTAR